MNESLRAVLPSIGVPEERCGRNRGSRLDPAELDLYRWILRSFSSGGSPSRQDIAHAARSLNVKVQRALKRMVEDDLIQCSASGDIDCAYPFSAKPTSHMVTLDNGVRLYAMCAIDALGIPAMLGHGCLIETADPVDGTAISLRVAASGRARAEPGGAVVLCAVADGSGPLSSLCCPLVNTFESSASAERFLVSHPGLNGPILSLVEAVECGAAVFGGVLD
ncbi:MAG: organomercurial lyase [Candidatus Dormibacteria bacterium]